ncbi:hypothetical protein BH11PSE8_BH11PSE8_10770 [soil metagenome]
MPGDERAVESLAAAHTMRLAGVVFPGAMLRGAAAVATSCGGSPDSARVPSLQAVIVIECDDLVAQRAHLLRLALPLADEAGADALLASAETGTCAIRFTQASVSASASAARLPRPIQTRSLASIEIAALAPQRLAAHLAQIIGVPVTRSAVGAPTLAFGGTQLRFIVADDSGEGLAAIDWAEPEAASPASAP